jgi:hypothetical protein
LGGLRKMRNKKGVPSLDQAAAGALPLLGTIELSPDWH